LISQITIWAQSAAVARIKRRRTTVNNKDLRRELRKATRVLLKLRILIVRFKSKRKYIIISNLIDMHLVDKRRDDYF